ncbi:MAG: PAS domain S-box protein [Acidobacteriota bacterium]|nr:PAS domain S-box protein [Acidobacteriota bacterium]
MRPLADSSQASGQALTSFMAAFSRLERRSLTPSWRLDEFWTNFGWLLTTSAAMIFCFALQIPNAGVFLLIAVIHSVFVGGWKTGLASASLATLYSAIFLSVPDQLFHYSTQESRGLIGIGVACFGTVVLIMQLRRRDSLESQVAAEGLRSANIAEESDRMFRNMADSAPVLLWLADTEGRRFYFNKRWLEATGRQLSDQVGEGWFASVHPDDLSHCRHRYRNAIKSCDRFEAEYRLITPSGNYCWVQDFGVPRLGQDGENLGFIGSCVDRTERKRVEQALHQLSGRLLELQDDERRRISRELHDTTAQNLAVLSMNLCVLKEATKLLGQKPRQAVAESLSLTERCSQEIRTLSYLLHPPLLDELGLVSALRAYAVGFTQRTGVQIDLKIEDIGRLPGEIETTLFRIVQEALTNVHRHSGSSRAEIRVVRDPKEVRLHVSDEGKGVPPESLELISEGASIGVGVAGMRERAIQLGGQLKIASSNKGTTITAILPLRGKE